MIPSSAPKETLRSIVDRLFPSAYAGLKGKQETVTVDARDLWVLLATLKACDEDILDYVVLPRER